MLVPRTAEGFIATVSTLQSLDGSKGVSFHTSLPEDRFVHLLVKNLGRHMPEDVNWEELENLCSGSLIALLWLPCSRSLPGQPHNTARYCVGTAGTRGGETAFPEGTLRPESLSGDIHCCERSFTMQALPMFQP